MAMFVAGDFLNCWGEERGPFGEKAVCAALENGVETGGVPAAICDGVRPCCEGVRPCCCEGVQPCCEAACFIGVGVAIVMGCSVGGAQRRAKREDYRSVCRRLQNMDMSRYTDFSY